MSYRGEDSFVKALTTELSTYLAATKKTKERAYDLQSGISGEVEAYY